MLNKIITEATEIDFKVAPEIKKPKSWLKSVSAFANGSGGCYLAWIMRTELKVRFAKKAQYRVDKPDYADRAVTEALVNALIHRDYIVRGSGLRKIVSETEKLPGYTEELRPEFHSTSTNFRVVLKNVNYIMDDSDQDTMHDTIHDVMYELNPLKGSRSADGR